MTSCSGWWMEGGAVSQGSRADRPTRPDTLRTSTADAAAVAPPARKLRKKRPLQNVTQRVTRKYARNSGKDWKNQVRNFIPLIDSVTFFNDSTFWVTLTLCKQCWRKMENTRKLIEVLLIRRYSRTIMFCHFASAHTNSTESSGRKLEERGGPLWH